MKIKEILMEDSFPLDKINAWLKDYKIYVQWSSGGNESIATLEDDADQVIPNGVISWQMISKEGGFTWNPPFDQKLWFETSEYSNCEVDITGVHGAITYNDFSNLPNVSELELNGANILSTKHAAGSMNNVSKIKLLVTNECFTRGFPILSLLKMSKLKRFIIEHHAGSNESRKFNRIIVDHLGGSVPDCQQELIEEGFERFAKL